MNDKNTSTLMGKLKNTILLFGVSMIVLWTVIYFGARFLLTEYTLQNMERAAQDGISQLNQSFLQMEQVHLALMQEKDVEEVFAQTERMEFHNAVAGAEARLQEMLRGKSFLNSVILYRADGAFYRLKGNISNTGVERLLYLIRKEEEDYICIKLDNENYIGYVTETENGTCGIIMLMKETDIERMLAQTGRNGMQYVLTVGGNIVVSGSGLPKGMKLEDFLSGAEHIKSAQVGYTPFQLWVAYTGKDGKVSALFLLAMAVMALLLMTILQVFLRFWRKNFFLPIQTIIDDVESFEGEKGKMLSLTGQEQFDGLIRSFNDMTARIEAKDRALIVSLKKQISDHFIYNVLNSIKALGDKGESEKAGELCNGLSLLLRYANEGESFIDGMEEFFMLEKYVDIMKIRYPNRFDAEIDMEDFLETMELPRMLLQPLVENSIVHGLVGGGKKGTVHVYARQEGEFNYFIVEDDGCGMSEEALLKLRNRLKRAPFSEPETEGLSRVALVNIERRIQSYFGGKYGLTVDSVEGKGTTVSVKLPAKL